MHEFGLALLFGGRSQPFLDYKSDRRYMCSPLNYAPDRQVHTIFKAIAVDLKTLNGDLQIRNRISVRSSPAHVRTCNATRPLATSGIGQLRLRIAMLPPSQSSRHSPASSAPYMMV